MRSRILAAPLVAAATLLHRYRHHYFYAGYMKRYIMPQDICPFPQNFTVAGESVSLVYDVAPLTYSGVSKAVYALYPVTRSSQ
jgi:hypothetical protein